MEIKKKPKNFFRSDNLLPDFLIAASFVIVAVPLWFFLHFWSLLIFAVLAANVLILIAHYKKISIPLLSDFVAKEYRRIKARLYAHKDSHQIRDGLEINYWKLLRHQARLLGYVLEINYLKFLHHLALLFRSEDDNRELLIHLELKLSAEENFLGENYSAFQAQKRRALRFSTWGSLALITAVFVLSIVFAPQSFAATSSWIQSNWSGGVSTVSVAINPGNKTNWTKYYSKSSTIEASSSVSLNTTSTLTIYTSTADFSASTLVNALAATNSIIMLKPLTATCAKGAECVSGQCVSGICAVQRIWAGAVNSDMNNPANYSGSGALLTTDELVFNSGSVAATASANLDVASISVTSGYTGNMSFAGYTATYETGNASFNGTGTLNLGNGLTMNGASGTLTIGSGVGTVTAGSCDVAMNGTTGMTLQEAKSTLFKSLTLGTGAIVTRANESAYTNFKTMTFNNNSTFTNNTAWSITIVPNVAGAALTVGTNVTLNGTGAWQIMPIPSAGSVATISALTYSGTGAWQFTAGNAGRGTNVIRLTGNFNIGSSMLTLDAGYVNNNYGMIFDANNFNITCGALRISQSSQLDVLVVNFGSGTHTINSFSSITAGNYSVINLQTSHWEVSGSWTYLSTQIVDPGTSLVTFTGTGASAVTSNGKTFYDITVNNASKAFSFVDNASLHNLTTTAMASYTHTGTTLTASGNVTFNGSGTLNLGNGLTMSGASGVLTIGSGVGAVTADNCDLTMNGTTAMVLDINKLIQFFKSFNLGVSAKVTFNGGQYIYPRLFSMGNNANLVLNNRIFLYPNVNGAPITIGTGVTWGGSYSFEISMQQTGEITIPEMHVPGAFSIRNYGVDGASARLIGDVSSNNYEFTIGGGGSKIMTFTTDNHNITCKEFRMGNSAVTITYNFGSSNISCTSVTNTYSTGAIINMENSQWTINGGWTMGSGWTVNPGTSLVTFTNTGTITSAGKSFYAVNVNASGKTITLADDMTVGGTCGNYNVLAGTVNLNGHTVINGDPCP